MDWRFIIGVYGLAEIEILDSEYDTSETQNLSEGRALCLKLILFPEKFTVIELIRLKDIMRAEGYQVD